MKYAHLSLQEIFDTVVTHLRTQGVKSFNEDTCLYRDAYNNKCAAGCLIPDSEYQLSMETCVVDKLVWFNINFSTLQVEFIKKLQQIHDRNKVENWESQWINLANIYNLTMPQKIKS
jgi:hypothetical protein